MWNFRMKFHEPNTLAVPYKSSCNVHLLLEPDNQNAKNNAAFFERTIKTRKVKPKPKKERAEYMDIYSSLCRGENNKVSGGARSRNWGGGICGATRILGGGKIKFYEISPPPRCQHF